MKDLVSIIVPVYNVKDYLEKCVLSIINQTYKNIEIILVDDGSTDGCGALCDDLLKKDKRISVIHQNNGGLSDARNKGIDNSSGKYIMFIDSDDYIENNMVEVLYNGIIKNKGDIAICNFYKNRNGKDIKHLFGNKSFIVEDDSKYKYLCNIYAARTVVSWNKIYKRNLFDDIRFPKGMIHEDQWIITDLLKKSKKIIYLMDEYLYHYVKRSNSIMGTFDNKRYDILKVYDKRIDFFKNHNMYYLMYKIKFMKLGQKIYLFFKCKLFNKSKRA